MAIGRTNVAFNLKKVKMTLKDYVKEDESSKILWYYVEIFLYDSPVKYVTGFGATAPAGFYSFGAQEILGTSFYLEIGKKYKIIGYKKMKKANSNDYELIASVEKDFFLEDDMAISLKLYGRTYPDISSTGVIYGPYKDDLKTLITNIDEEPNWNIIIKDSQTLTFNRFYDDVDKIDITMVAGGGAGGSAVNQTLGNIKYTNGGGGGQGGQIRIINSIPLSTSISYPITIGTGGKASDGGDTTAFGETAVGGAQGNKAVSPSTSGTVGGGEGIEGYAVKSKNFDEELAFSYGTHGGSGSGCALINYSYVYNKDSGRLYNWIDDDNRDPGWKIFDSEKYVGQGGGGGDGYNGGNLDGFEWGWLACPGGEERWIEGTSKSCWELSDETHFGWGRTHCGDYSITTYSADAEANTGGGGGGGDHTITAGGNGGSGVVIIRNHRE